jgi:hypothetical protein
MRRSWSLVENLEARTLLDAAPPSAAMQIVGVYQARQDFPDADGAIPDGHGGSTPLSVVVIDSGLYHDHPLLQPAYETGLDVFHGTNDPVDVEGHGTHVAGIIGARDPNIGVAQAVGLIGLRVMNDDQPHGHASEATVSKALEWVINSVENGNPYHIVAVNMSLGFGYFTDPNDPQIQGTERDDIQHLQQDGVTVVCAAGNGYGAHDGQDFQYANSSSPGIFATLDVGSVWPADEGGPFPGPNRIWVPGRTVDVSTAPDAVFSSSQRPNTDNVVFAPGGNILSTYNDGGTQTESGTSMASPLVAGIVALLQDEAYTYAGNFLAPDQVRQVLQQTADTIHDDTQHNNAILVRDDGSTVPLTDTNASYPRVNVDRALALVKQMAQGGRLGGGGPVGGGAPVGDPNGSIASARDLGTLNGSIQQNADGSFASYEVAAPGTIGVDGGVTQVGATDVDMFHFRADFDGTVTIKTASLGQGSDVDSVLRLFDASGNELAINDDDPSASPFSRIDFDVQAGVDYYVGVSGTGNDRYNPTQPGSGAPGATGNYQLQLLLHNSDPNGTISGAVDVGSLPQDKQGFIGADFGKPVGTQDVDIFRVVVPDNGVLDASLDIPDQNGLVDSAIRVFWENRDTHAIQEVGTAQFSQVSIRTYRGDVLFVAVSDFANESYDPENTSGRTADGAGGFYTLHLSFRDNDLNGSIAQARDESGSGSFNQDGIIGTDGNPQAQTVQEVGDRDVDFLKFTPTQSGVLHVQVQGKTQTIPAGDSFTDYTGQAKTLTQDMVFNPLATSVRIFDGSGNLLASSTDASGSVLELKVTSNTDYFIGVSAANNNNYDPTVLASGSPGTTGGYNVTASVLTAQQSATILGADTIDVASGPPAGLPSIAVGARTGGDIGYDGTFFRGATDYDAYVFRPTTTQNVLVRVVPTGEFGVDPYLRVFDSHGAAIASAGSAQDGSAAVRVAVSSGQTYYISVSGEGNQTYGLSGSGTAPGRQGDYGLALDVAAPLVMPNVALAAADDTGAAGDGLTRVNQPHLVGTTTAGAAVELDQVGPGGVIAAVLAHATAASSDGSFSLQPSHPLGPGAYMFQVRATDSLGGTTTSSLVFVTIRPGSADFDGDGTADPTTFAPYGLWQQSDTAAGARAQYFGAQGDIPLQGDFDGDGKLDLAVYRPSAATWFIQRSSLGFEAVTFGIPNLDQPVPADYDGTGHSQIAVFRPNTAEWWIHGDSGLEYHQFGAGNLDRPIPADFDGDSKSDVAVYRPNTSQWFILGSSRGPSGQYFGAVGDVPIPADYDGDGKADVGVFRPGSSEWFINRSSAGFRYRQFGAGNLDIPVPADYDGDGKADLGVFRPNTAQWFLARSTAGPGAVTVGSPGDLPVLAPYAYRTGRRAGVLSSDETGTASVQSLDFGRQALTVSIAGSAMARRLAQSAGIPPLVGGTNGLAHRVVTGQGHKPKGSRVWFAEG